tara:strand:+ start:364 stop:531 length:168 start_codon:yes stop_codon:yes gene_type:complete
LNFKFLSLLFLLTGCGLKTLPVPPKKKFQPIEKKYIKEYKPKTKSEDKTKEKKKE